jgi:hypothetical protein
MVVLAYRVCANPVPWLLGVDVLGVACLVISSEVLCLFLKRKPQYNLILCKLTFSIEFAAACWLGSFHVAGWWA